MCARLNALGHDAVHSLSLPAGNRTKDHAIAAFADLEDRIVVSKDTDFLVSHRINGTSRTLLLVTTGNIPIANCSRFWRQTSMRLVCSLKKAAA
jgi:predicted nuclease of predicted toxin-antitoxin system